MEQDRNQFAVMILWDVSTGRNEMDNYFATEAYTMVDIVCEVKLNKNWF